MRRLNGTDTVLLLTETDTCPQHTLKIAIVDPSGSTLPVDFATFREQMRDAVTRLEPLRWRLVRSPGDIAHPAWIDAPVQDIDPHLHQVTLPSPGGRRELCALVSAITEPVLARDKPLWEIWYVEGLEEGRIAYVAKVHHALADGVSSGELLALAFAPGAPESPESSDGSESSEAEAEAEAAAGVAPTAEFPPDRRAQWRTVGREITGMARRFPPLLAHTARAAGRIRRLRRTIGRVGQTKPFSGPHTRLDAPLTSRRTFAYERIPLATVTSIAHATGTTVTSVSVATVGGALRRYLADRGELPTDTLTTTVPVSVRGPEVPSAWGTHVASWYLPLGTDIADPVERLQMIAAHAEDARAELETSDPQLQQAWAEYWRLFRGVTLGLPRVVRRWWGRPSYNVIVSTVRASPEPLARDGVQLVELVSVGPLVEGIGLNVTAWSYAGAMTFALLACADHVDDVWTLAAALRDSVDELADAVGAPTGGASLADRASPTGGASAAAAGWTDRPGGASIPDGGRSHP